MTEITPLAGLRAADLPLVGGKAAGLGPLVDHGLPVPPGFCITTSAYHRAVRPVADQIRAAVSRATSGAGGWATAAQEVAALIVDLPMPEDLVVAIDAAYGELGSPSVAVRSSATAEDLAQASFAGLQETFLNVVGLEALLRAVRGCWASLWSEPAMTYRARHGIDPDEVGMAVVVQELVAAERAGVAFTADPVSGSRSHLVIEATWGLGEALVGGLVTPDRVVVARGSGTVLEYAEGSKHLRSVVGATGLDLVEADPAHSGRRAVDAALVAELRVLADRIESLCGGPTDIEWATDARGVWITQARPITVLPHDLGDAEWSREMLIERYPDPITPFTWSVVSSAFFDSLQTTHELMGGHLPEGETLVRAHDGRGYLNVTAFDRGMATLPLRPPVASSSNAAGQDAEDGAPEVHGGTAPEGPPRRTGAALAAGVRTLQVLLMAHREWERELPEYVAHMAADAQRPAPRTPIELMAAKRRHALAVVPLLNNHAKTLAATHISLELLGSVTRRWLGDEDGRLVVTLLSGLSGNRSVETNQALWQLARGVPPGGPLAAALRTRAVSPEAIAALEGGPELLAGLPGLLDRFGHRSPRYDLAHPTWRDEPAQVLELLGVLVNGTTVEPELAEARQREARMAAEASARARLALPQRLAFDWVLRLAQTYFRLRENQQFSLTLGVPALRSILHSLGTRFVERGWLSAAEDIYFLTETEVDALGDLLAETPGDAGGPGRHTGVGVLGDPAAVVARRRTDFARWQQHDPGMRLGRGADTARPDADALTGTAASAGTVTGPVRIVRGPADFGAVRPGEILVAPATTPAWTPLFGVAAGLVTEYGGLLSHSGVMAREYGIPAVLGVTGALGRLHDGQVVTIDGTRGRVTTDADAGTDAAGTAAAV